MPRTVIAIVSALGLLLAACDDGTEGGAASNEASADAAATGSEDDPDTTDTAVEATEDASNGGSNEAADAPSAGTAVVVVGDERYETDSVDCVEATSGTQFGSVSDGPRENSQIRGLFGSTILPDLVAVTFDGGSEGEWRALADDGLSILEDYTFDEDAGTFEGTATFVWFQAGLQDADQLIEGTFEVRCG